MPSTAPGSRVSVRAGESRAPSRASQLPSADPNRACRAVSVPQSRSGNVPTSQLVVRDVAASASARAESILEASVRNGRNVSDVPPPPLSVATSVDLDGLRAKVAVISSSHHALIKEMDTIRDRLDQAASAETPTDDVRLLRTDVNNILEFIGGPNAFVKEFEHKLLRLTGRLDNLERVLLMNQAETAKARDAVEDAIQPSKRSQRRESDRHRSLQPSPEDSESSESEGEGSDHLADRRSGRHRDLPDESGRAGATRSNFHLEKGRIKGPDTSDSRNFV